jgi:hypothetical protein
MSLTDRCNCGSGRRQKSICDVNGKFIKLGCDVCEQRVDRGQLPEDIIPDHKPPRLASTINKLAAQDNANASWSGHLAGGVELGEG